MFFSLGRSRRSAAVACWLWAGVFTPVALSRAAEAPADERGAAAESVASEVAVVDAEALALAGQIDGLLREHWRQAGLAPAQPASDAEFIRRAYLDFCGTVPLVSEVRQFLVDERPDKRARLIEHLLAQPMHSLHLAFTWRELLLPDEDPDQPLTGVADLDEQLRSAFADNLRYDNLVADLLSAQGSGGGAAFFTALQSKPEAVAASTARIFLGVQIDCAQCHDHPFDRWKQADFWGYAALFARVAERQVDGQMRTAVFDVERGEVLLPESEDVAAPRYLGEDESLADGPFSRRSQAAVWIVSRDNPYFARAAVNRFWALLFGRGLVEPLDDFSEHNPPAHPAVLDGMARFFVESGYDVRRLLRALGNTQAYQLSSGRTDGQPPAPPESFAQMAVKSLTPDQLFDALARVTRRPPPAQTPGALDPLRQEFVAQFRQAQANRLEFSAGIPHALTLLNGALVAELTDPDRCSLLQALEAPWLSERQRLDVLFLAAFARAATAREAAEFLPYLESGGARGDVRQARSDVLWALLNSGEFLLNH